MRVRTPRRAGPPAIGAESADRTMESWAGMRYQRASCRTSRTTAISPLLTAQPARPSFRRRSASDAPMTIVASPWLKRPRVKRRPSSSSSRLAPVARVADRAASRIFWSVVSIPVSVPAARATARRFARRSYCERTTVVSRRLVVARRVVVQTTAKRVHRSVGAAIQRLPRRMSPVTSPAATATPRAQKSRAQVARPRAVTRSNTELPTRCRCCQAIQAAAPRRPVRKALERTVRASPLSRIHVAEPKAAAAVTPTHAVSRGRPGKPK